MKWVTGDVMSEKVAEVIRRVDAKCSVSINKTKFYYAHSQVEGSLLYFHGNLSLFVPKNENATEYWMMFYEEEFDMVMNYVKMLRGI